MKRMSENAPNIEVITVYVVDRNQHPRHATFSQKIRTRLYRDPKGIKPMT